MRRDYDKYRGLSDRLDEAERQEGDEGVDLDDLLEEKLLLGQTKEAGDMTE